MMKKKDNVFKPKMSRKKLIVMVYALLGAILIALIPIMLNFFE